MVQVVQTYDDLGGVKMRLDASNLEQYGSMRWFLDSVGVEEYREGSAYAPADAFYESDAIYLQVVESSDQLVNSYDWVYVIRGIEGQNIR